MLVESKIVLFCIQLWVTEIGGRVKPGFFFFSKRVRWTLLTPGALRWFTSWRWIDHPTSQLRSGHSTTELSPLVLFQRRVILR